MTPEFVPIAISGLILVATGTALFLGVRRGRFWWTARRVIGLPVALCLFLATIAVANERVSGEFFSPWTIAAVFAPPVLMFCIAVGLVLHFTLGSND